MARGSSKSDLSRSLRNPAEAANTAAMATREPTKLGNGKPYTGEIGTSSGPSIKQVSALNEGTKAFAQKYKMPTSDELFRIAGLKKGNFDVVALGEPIVSDMAFVGEVRQVFAFTPKDGGNTKFIGINFDLSREPASSEASIKDLVTVPYDQVTGRNSGMYSFGDDRAAVAFKYAGKPFKTK